MWNWNSLVRKYIQEIIFGFEDSFVSTVGAITGIAAGASNKTVVVLAGVVIIAVEAASMASGSYLSEKTRKAALAGVDECGYGGRKSVVAGLIMGVSYIFAGIVPLVPYLFLQISEAMVASIILTLVSLFLLGVWHTRFTKQSWLRSGAEMLLIGSAAIAIGFAIGNVASKILGVDVL